MRRRQVQGVRAARFDRLSCRLDCLLHSVARRQRGRGGRRGPVDGGGAVDGMGPVGGDAGGGRGGGRYSRPQTAALLHVQHERDSGMR